MSRLSKPAVIGGILQHVSPSQITTFLDCKRAWYLSKVKGISRPAGPAAALGEKYHKVLEILSRGGQVTEYPDQIIGDSVSRAMELAAKAGYSPHTETRLTDPELRIADVPVEAYIDRWGPGLIIDWKTTSDFSRLPTWEQIAKGPQLTIYAAWMFAKYPELGECRVGHIYLKTRGKGAAEPRFGVVTRKEVSDRIDRLAAVVERMKQVAVISNASELVCTCSWRDKCSTIQYTTQTAAPAAGVTDVSSGKEITKQSYLMYTPEPTSPALVLLINAVPITGSSNYQLLERLIAERAKPICEAKGVSDLRAIKFAEWKAPLAASFRQDPPRGIVYATSGELSDVVIEALLGLPDVLAIKGVR